MRLSFFVLTVVLILTACSREPINSPYPSGAQSDNVLYTSFGQRSPKYLDPASSYSSDETPFTYSIYEPLYGYHYLQRPYQLKARAAQAIVDPVYYDNNGNRLPDDTPGEQIALSVYDIPIKPGILFQPHPAFARNENGDYRYYPIQAKQLAGKYAIPDFEHTGTRELTAHDYVYAIRRLASPEVVSPIFGVMAEHIVGLRDYAEHLKVVRQQQDKQKQPWFDLRPYAFEGAEALDSHTLRIRVRGKYPQFKYWLAMTFLAPIPWEADRFYQQPGMAEHNLSLNTWPVGTGPYQLTESIQNQRHVLGRNPNFRGESYPCDGEEGDALKGLLDDCGQLTPFIDEIVFSIEKESVPLLGKFIQGYYDVPQADDHVYGVSLQVAASDSAAKAELYKERDLQLLTSTEAQIYYFGFNWLDPVVGQGDTPEQAEKNRKLRQAISIAFNWEQYIAIFLNGQGEVAHGPVPPNIPGYQPPPQGLNRQVYLWESDRAVRRPLDEAKRLLAEAGYPGGRDEMTGAPLVLHFDSAGGMGSSATLDWMRQQLQKLNVELEVRATDYNRFQDKMRQGTAQMFMWGWVADYPDPENFLFLLYGPNAKATNGGENAANYQSDEFDRLFEAMRYLDEGPEKEALVHKMVSVVQNDMPWMFGFYPRSGGAYQAWVANAKPTQMARDTLQYLRVDAPLRSDKIRAWNPPLWWPAWLVLVLLLGLAYPAYRISQRRNQATGLSRQTKTEVS